MQTLPSSQSSAVPAWHTVATHVSIPLQTLLSLQSASVVHEVAGAGERHAQARPARVARGRRFVRTPSRSPLVPPVGGRIAHPKLVDGAADHACRLVVTSTGYAVATVAHRGRRRPRPPRRPRRRSGCRPSRSTAPRRRPTRRRWRLQEWRSRWKLIEFALSSLVFAPTQRVSVADVIGRSRGDLAGAARRRSRRT